MSQIPNYKPVIKNFLILLITAVVVIATHRAVFFASAEGAEVDRAEKYIAILRGEHYTTDIENTEDATDELVQTYHKIINDLFNARIAGMVQLGNTNVEKMLAAITPPKVENEKRAPCKGPNNQQNLSTYCLALDATSEYFAFRKAMIEARRVAKEQAARRFTGTVIEQRNLFQRTGDLFTGQKNIQGYGEVISRIDRETDIARQSLDQGLAAYSELQMALPLHQKYVEVIKSLEAYRDKVSAIRRQIELYPSTFLDVTTTQCT